MMVENHRGIVRIEGPNTVNNVFVLMRALRNHLIFSQINDLSFFMGSAFPPVLKDLCQKDFLVQGA